MKLIYYSKNPNLTEIDPSYMGTGAPSAENRFGVPKVKRSFFYTEGSEPEPIVLSSSPHKYEVNIPDDHKLYDIYEDPQSIVQNSKKTIGRLDSDHFLNEIKNAGYHGYYTTSPNSMNNVISLFHKTPVNIAKPESLYKNNGKFPPHFILTSENAPYKKTTQSKSAHELHEDLLKQGENAHLIDDMYGSPEKSVIVFNPKNINNLHKIALAHGQESAINSNGTNHEMFFYHGPHAGYKIQGSGTEIFQNPPKDYYSTLQTANGPLHFSHNFDFNNYIKDLSIPQSTESKYEDPWDNAKESRGGEEEFSNAINNHLTNNNLKKNVDENGQLAPYTDKLNKVNKSIEQDYINDNKNVFDSPVKVNYAGEYEGPTSENIYYKLYKNVDPNLLYRSYKNSPHNPLSVGLKYAIHRIENSDKYLDAGKNEKDLLDTQFLDHHLNTNNEHAKKMTINDLREFLNKNPELPSRLLNEQHKLHEFLQKYSNHGIRNVQGIPSVALTRGLDTNIPGKEHALSSYADIPNTGFGSVMHHRFVPLNNVWFGYDTGHQYASSSEFGPENEYLVSPHNNVQAGKGDIKPLSIPRHHMYNVDQQEINKHKLHTYQTDIKQEYLKDVLNKGPKISSLRGPDDYSFSDYKKALTHPSTTPEMIDESINNLNQYSRPEFLQYAKLNQNHQNKIINNSSKDDLYYLLNNKTLTPESLSLLSNSPYPLIRAGVTKHPNVTYDLLNKLKDDPYDTVRLAAHTQLKLRPPEKLTASEKLNKALNQKTFDHFDAMEGAYTSATHRGMSPFKHERQIESHKNPEHNDYIKFGLQDKEQLPQKHSPGGMFPKEIHKWGDDTYMVKPYYHHNYNDPDPLAQGWSALTASDMYHAAGLGHMTGSVSGHNYVHPNESNIPVIVHKFEDPKKWQTLEQNEDNGTYNQILPADLMKVGVLHYLMAHQDTHSGNILISKERNKLGYNDTKYIDHDLAFHYGEGAQNPQRYIIPKFNDINAASNHINYHGDIATHLSNTIDWWNKNKENIKNSFMNNLKSVIGKRMKSYLKSNLEERYNHLDELFNKNPEKLLNNEATNAKLHTLEYPVDRG